MQTRHLYWIGLAAIAVLALSIAAYFVWHPALRGPKKLTVAVTRAPDSALVYIARDLGYLRRLVTDEPQAVEAFLRALKKTEHFARQKPAKALEIAAKATLSDREMLKALWGDFSVQVSLDQALLVGMENQARWAVGEKLVVSKTLPNFLDFIYFGGVEAVSPETVTISH